MLTEEQCYTQELAADELEQSVMSGRWDGITRENLFIISADPGISIEVELNSYQKGLSLVGLPDFSEDGKYLLEFVINKDSDVIDRKAILAVANSFSPTYSPDIVCDILVENEQIKEKVFEVLDNIEKSRIKQ